MKDIDTKRKALTQQEGEWTDGETTYRVPLRSFYVIADNLTIHAGATSHALVGDSEGELTPFGLRVQGVARLSSPDGLTCHVKSMIRPTEHRTDSFSLHLHPYRGESDNRWSRNVELALIEGDPEDGRATEWYIDCGVPDDLFNELVTAIRQQRVASFRLGIHFANLYVTSLDWRAASSSDSIDWYLPPQEAADGTYRDEAAARGYVSDLDWQEPSLTFSDPETDADENADKNEAQDDARVTKSLEQIRRVLIVLTVAVAIIAFKLFVGR